MGSSQTTQPTRCDVLELGASTAVDSTIGRSCAFIPRNSLKLHIGEQVTADDMKSYLGRIPGFAHTTPHESRR
jgi:hypothetical protein